MGPKQNPYMHAIRSLWRKSISTLAAAMVVVAAATAATPSHSQTTGATALKLGPSGLPLPRFVSLKSGRVNMRVGPGTQYAVEWLYLKPGLPMEIIQEYDNWRRVRDADGAEGWINQALLSGRRTGIVTPWFKGKEGATVPLLADPETGARKVAEIEPGGVGCDATCSGQWCQMISLGRERWVSREAMRGVNPGSTVKGCPSI